MGGGTQHRACPGPTTSRFSVRRARSPASQSSLSRHAATVAMRPRMLGCPKSPGGATSRPALTSSGPICATAQRIAARLNAQGRQLPCTARPADRAHGGQRRFPHELIADAVSLVTPRSSTVGREISASPPGLRGADRAEEVDRQVGEQRDTPVVPGSPVRHVRRALDQPYDDLDKGHHHHLTPLKPWTARWSGQKPAGAEDRDFRPYGAVTSSPARAAPRPAWLSWSALASADRRNHGN
jgi:hypothetical protein